MQLSIITLTVIAAKLTTAGPLVERGYNSYSMATGSAIVQSVNDMVKWVHEVAQLASGKPASENSILLKSYLCPMTKELSDSIDDAQSHIKDGLKKEHLSDATKKSISDVVKNVENYVADMEKNVLFCDKLSKLTQKTDKLERLSGSSKILAARDAEEAQVTSQHHGEDDDNDDYDIDDEDGKRNERTNGKSSQKKSSMNYLVSAVGKTLSALQKTTEKHYGDKGISKRKYDDDFACEFSNELKDAVENLYKQKKKGQLATNYGDIKTPADAWVKKGIQLRINCQSDLQKLAKYAKLL